MNRDVTFAAAPVVSNVTASQRPGTKLVDISYNVSDSDGDLQTIGVEISGDGGLTYTIPATALSGHVGSWINSTTSLRVADRNDFTPTSRNDYYGFRCARGL